MGRTPEVTGRRSVNELTSDQLDDLYLRAEQAEAAVTRARAVIAESRARVAELEADHGGSPLPMGHPLAGQCDAISNLCHDVETALQNYPAPSGIPLHDEQSTAEVAAQDRAYWTTRYDH
ncbi:hypothetical protein [Streptomyces sp. NPDC046821]|uniref:hypothetical protein n=1 Tax=Streptomyces sp. NPDC046821 TaxID=3154702 RepID=UPI0033E520FC